MMKCKDCGNLQAEDESGIDGYCNKCKSENLENVKEEEEDYKYPEYDMKMHSAVEVANDILSKWGR